MRFLPAAVAARLSTIGPREIVPRSSLTQQQKKEFMKTASFVQREPWNMERTYSYIDNLIHANEHGSQQWQLPDIDWLREVMPETVVQALPPLTPGHDGSDLSFSVRAPALVSVRGGVLPAPVLPSAATTSPSVPSGSGAPPSAMEVSAPEGARILKRPASSLPRGGVPVCVPPDVQLGCGKCDGGRRQPISFRILRTAGGVTDTVAVDVCRCHSNATHTQTH